MKRTEYTLNKHRGRGITLLEALIALAIVSVGLLAIAKLHGELLTGTAETKTRSEAVRLASAEIERLRGNPERLVAGNTTSTHEGTNAEFTIERSVVAYPDAGSDPALHNAQITVSWDSPWGGSEEVNVTSNIVWDNLADIGSIARGRLPGGEQSPPGSGRERSGAEPLPTDEAVARQIIGEYEERYREEDGRRQVLRDGEVIIEIDDPDNDGFATISGFVFRASNRSDHDMKHFEVIRSDTYTVQPCINVPLTNADISREDDDLDFGSDVLGDDNINGDDNVMMFYQCFAGQDWYGNIELLRTTDPSQRQPPREHTVCLGDPQEEELDGFPSANWGSRHYAQKDRRRYRAEGSLQGIRQGSNLGVQPEFRVNEEKLPSIVFYNQDLADDADDSLPGFAFGHHFVLKDQDKSCTGNDMSDDFRTLLKGNVGQNYCFNADGDSHVDECSRPVLLPTEPQ